MKIKDPSINRDQLKRCKKTSPEAKLEWLAAAVEFARAKKTIKTQHKN